MKNLDEMEIIQSTTSKVKKKNPDEVKRNRKQFFCCWTTIISNKILQIKLFLNDYTTRALLYLDAGKQCYGKTNSIT